MTKRELAGKYFLAGYNCAQAVLCAFCDELCLTREQAAAMASPFGGGMGRMREVCGACSAVFLALGILYGYDKPGDEEAKAALYGRVQTLGSVCRSLHGSLICRELLGGHADTSATPTKRDAAFYEQRPCLSLVEDMAEALEQYLAKYPPVFCEYSVGAVPCTIRDGEYRFLLVGERAGHIGFPKGHIQSGECEAECARREVLEETGISVRIDANFRKSVSYPLPNGRKKAVAYYVATYEPDMIPHAGADMTDAVECGFEEAQMRLTHPALRHLLEEAYEYLLLSEDDP